VIPCALIFHKTASLLPGREAVGRESAGRETAGRGSEVQVGKFEWFSGRETIDTVLIDLVNFSLTIRINR